jgi:DNA-binding transcriptional LysR family regulator
MRRGDSLDDLAAFAAVVREGTFTKAAAKLNISQSALSQTIRQLEARLGVRLLTRTTRSVAPTEAGERLKKVIAPRLEEIESELASLRELRQKPAGTVRITATEFAIDSILLPKLTPLMRDNPDLKVEFIVDYGLSNIVVDRYDAGVRSGEQVAKDMIAVRIAQDMQMAVVGAPSYFKGRSEPKKPQDLVTHNCIYFIRAADSPRLRSIWWSRPSNTAVRNRAPFHDGSSRGVGDATSLAAMTVAVATKQAVAMNTALKPAHPAIRPSAGLPKPSATSRKTV